MSKELTEELEITLDKDDSYTRYLVILFVIVEETLDKKLKIQDVMRP